MAKVLFQTMTQGFKWRRESVASVRQKRPPVAARGVSAAGRGRRGREQERLRLHRVRLTRREGERGAASRCESASETPF